MRVEPGQQGGQGGAAQAVGDVAVDKSGRAAGQIVDVRGPHQRIAHKAEVSVALIVGNDEQDVGWGGPEMAGRPQAECRQQKNGQSALPRRLRGGRAPGENALVLSISQPAFLSPCPGSATCFARCRGLDFRSAGAAEHRKNPTPTIPAFPQRIQRETLIVQPGEWSVNRSGNCDRMPAETPQGE